MQEEKEKIKLPHNVILEGRKSLSVSGVTDVLCYDENAVMLLTNLGELSIRGSDLHVSQLDVSTGELSMEGSIISLVYSEEQTNKKSGLFSKLFK